MAHGSDPDTFRLVKLRAATNPPPSSQRPAVVFLPGLAATAATWTDMAERFSTEYVVRVLDLPGFGKTSPPASGMSVSSLAETLASTIRSEGFDEVVVIAHSLGTMVALDMVPRLPELTRLVLISGATCTLFNFYHAPLRVFLKEPLLVLRYLLLVGAASTPYTSRTIPWLLWRSSYLRKVFLRPFIADPAGLSSKDIAVLFDGFGTLNTLRIALNGGKFDFEASAARLQGVEVSAAAGDQDGLSSERDRAYYAGVVLAKKPMVVWPKLGHAPMIEAPEVVAAWLSETLRCAPTDSR